MGRGLDLPGLLLGTGETGVSQGEVGDATGESEARRMGVVDGPMRAESAGRSPLVSGEASDAAWKRREFFRFNVFVH